MDTSGGCVKHGMVCSMCTTLWARTFSGNSSLFEFFPMRSMILNGPNRRGLSVYEGQARAKELIKNLYSSETESPALYVCDVNCF